MTASTALPRLNLHGLLVDGIRTLIERGELQPGRKISEAALCSRFEVSRTPLREALKVLAAEGMVELRPRRGAVVASISHKDIDELFPIMAALEALAGELLCPLLEDTDIARMQAMHDRMVGEHERRDELAYLATNRAFHEALFELAGNATLQVFYAQILTRIRSCRFVLSKSEANWDLAMAEHVSIMAAMAARDARELSYLLRRHVVGVTIGIARDALDRVEAQELAELPSDLAHMHVMVD